MESVQRAQAAEGLSGEVLNLLEEFEAELVDAGVDLEESDIAFEEEVPAAKPNMAIGDYILGRLADANRPLRKQTLVQLCNAWHPGYVANVLNQDARFSRVGKDLYAPTAWGFKPYVGILKGIAALLEMSGQAHIDEVIDYFDGQGVSETSIRSYAASSPFCTVDDVVQFRTTTDDSADVPDTQLRRVFRVPGGVLARFEITGEHLRGSGFPVSMGFARWLGIADGGASTFVGHVQTLRVTRRRQVNISSIRQTLRSLEAAVGDFGFIECLATGSWSLTINPRRALEQMSPLERAGCLVGLKADELRIINPFGIAVQVGLRLNSEDTDCLRLSTIAANRGDSELAEALRSAWHESRSR